MKFKNVPNTIGKISFGFSYQDRTALLQLIEQMLTNINHEFHNTSDFANKGLLAEGLNLQFAVQIALLSGFAGDKTDLIAKNIC